MNVAKTLKMSFWISVEDVGNKSAIQDLWTLHFALSSESPGRTLAWGVRDTQT